MAEKPCSPPFDPEELGLHRHGAYLTAREVVFVFEAPEVEWIVNDLVDDPVLSSAFGPLARDRRRAAPACPRALLLVSRGGDDRRRTRALALLFKQALRERVAHELRSA